GDGIPERLTKNDHGGRCDGDADERVESHSGGKPESLADDLIALAVGVTGEIRNVQRDGGPETDDAGERRDKEAEEFAEGLKFRGRGEHGAETASFRAGPEEKRQSDEEQERSGDALQEANRFDAAKNDQHVDEKHGEERLPPIHTPGDHTAGEHIRGNVYAHGNPQGGIIVGTPDAAFTGDGSEVLVVERTAFDGFRTKRGAVRINHREGPFPFLSQIATAFAADAGDKLAGSGAGCSLRASDFAVGFWAA